MCNPPMGIQSEKTILLFRNTPTVVIFAPRSTIIAPLFLSSFSNVDAPDASGVIKNFSTDK